MGRTNAARTAAARRRSAGRRPSEGELAAQARRQAEQELIERRARRRRFAIRGGAGGGALILIIAIALIVLATAFKTAPETATAGVTDQTVAMISAVPASALNQVGGGDTENRPVAVAGPTSLLGPAGKPELLYVGDLWCSDCAAQRWAAVIALDRFGTMQNLTLTESSAKDAFPDTHTFSFAGITYTSEYLDFVPVELQNGDYKALDPLTAAQQSVMKKYDALPYLKEPGAVPFYDFGGRLVANGAMFSPQVLRGQDWTTIAGALSTPGSADAQAIDGAANLMTAGICIMTDDKPASVCKSTAVTTLINTM